MGIAIYLLNQTYLMHVSSNYTKPNWIDQLLWFGLHSSYFTANSVYFSITRARRTTGAQVKHVQTTWLSIFSLVRTYNWFYMCALSCTLLTFIGLLLLNIWSRFFKIDMKMCVMYITWVYITFVYLNAGNITTM